jgi:hypothetical protein
MAQSIILTFTTDKVTPGTKRFKENAEPGVRPTVGSVYVLKDKLQEAGITGDRIVITIEAL